MPGKMPSANDRLISLQTNGANTSRQSFDSDVRMKLKCDVFSGQLLMSLRVSLTVSGGIGEVKEVEKCGLEWKCYIFGCESISYSLANGDEFVNKCILGQWAICKLASPLGDLLQWCQLIEKSRSWTAYWYIITLWHSQILFACILLGYWSFYV